MPQELIIHGYFTVKEVVSFYSGFCGTWPNKDRVNWLLRRLELDDKKDKKVRQLSGGMKRRLLIAKALSHSPSLLILDEPTAGVDITLRNTLWDFIKELKEESSILFTTHYLEEAEKLCDRAAFIHKGKIRQIGPIDELISSLTNREILIKFHEKKKISSQYYVKSQGDWESFFIPYSLSIGEFLKELDLEINQIKDLKIKEGSLEDVFNTVMREKS